MFRKSLEPAHTVSIFVDGAEIAAEAGESVAAVLLRTPPFVARATPVKESPRAPYCMMGVCFDCLAIVDGVASVQTCQIEVRAGLRVERPRGRRSVP